MTCSRSLDGVELLRLVELTIIISIDGVNRVVLEVLLVEVLVRVVVELSVWLQGLAGLVLVWGV